MRRGLFQRRGPGAGELRHRYVSARRHSRAGVSGQGALLDALRRQMALDYLAGKKVSVNETAYLVGFSDPAAFSPAFKRWTAKSPRMCCGVREGTVRQTVKRLVCALSATRPSCASPAFSASKRGLSFSEHSCAGLGHSYRP